MGDIEDSLIVCLLILPLKTVCLRSLRLVMSASQQKSLSIYDQLELIDDVQEKKLKLAAAAKTHGIGSEKQAVVVGKSAKPCCFKNVKTLPFSYFANRKAWVTSQLFTDVMKTLDRKMMAQNRKIILFLDNATCHNLLPGTNLSNIKLSFMPPNTTSLIQPLDQGIIRSFKAYYRRELV